MHLSRRQFLQGDFSERAIRPLKVVINAACVALHGVVCRACGDACEKQAIRFRVAARGIAIPGIDIHACDACGACRDACPVGAVVMLRKVHFSFASGVRQ